MSLYIFSQNIRSSKLLTAYISDMLTTGASKKLWFCYLRCHHAIDATLGQQRIQKIAKGGGQRL